MEFLAKEKQAQIEKESSKKKEKGKYDDE